MVVVPAVPYRGIRPFRYADHPIFFARERETRQLVRLVDVYRGVFLYGDSGNGKSSLVNAGLLPQALELGFEPVRVRVQPRAGEEIVIEQIAARDDGSAFLPCVLAAHGDNSARIVLSIAEFEERLRAASRRQQPLVVFDQFEEILTLFEDDDVSRRALAQMIVGLLREALPVKLLFAFREDYLGRVKQLLQARPELVDQALRLGPPPPDALEAIIRGPFERYPGHFKHELDPPLAARLQKALANRFGAGEVSLSEVQTVCLRLWQAPEPATLLEAKGVQGLLEDELGEALATFPPDLRAAAVALLSQMVTSAGTRNVISAEDLQHRVHDDDPDIAPELIDEALERLDRDSKLVRRERRRDIYLYEITSEFLVPWISTRREEARIAQAERHRERERAGKRRRLGVITVIVGLLMVAVIVGGLAVWALGQRAAAARQSTEVSALALAATATNHLRTRPDVSLLLALEAYRVSPRVEARSSVISALTAARGSGVRGILRGHAATVFDVAFSPDGRTVASGSADGTIRLWDPRTNRQIGGPLRGHATTVYGVAFSPDGRMLASAGADATIRLWNVRTRRQVGQPLRGHRDAIYSADFSADGRTLVSASDDTTVRLWDVRTHGQIGRPLMHPKPVLSAAFSPDGRTVASGADDDKVRFWDVRLRRRLGAPLSGHGDRVVHVAFSPDGATLASASFDSTIRLWDARARRPTARLIDHDRATYAVAFSPDGRTLASSSADRTVRRWSVRTHRQLGVLTGHADTIFSIAFSPDGRTLASGGNDTTIRIADSRIQRGPLIGHNGAVRGVAFSHDAKTVASAGTDNTVRLWDVRTHLQRGKPLVGHVASVYSVAFSGDDRLLASAGADNTVRLWDVRRQRQIGRPLTGHRAAVNAVAVSRDGTVVASAGSDGTIRLWDVGAQRPRAVLNAHSEAVYAVAFGPRGILASGGADNMVRLWDVRTGRPLGKPLAPHTDFVYDVAFSPDGRALASAGYDNTIRHTDVRTHRQLGAFVGHIDPVYSVAFSPDGRTLVSASGDTTVRLWDARSRKQSGALTGHSGSVYSVDFSRDGTIAAGGTDGVIRLRADILWSDFSELQPKVCKLTGGGLRKTEWERRVKGIPYRESCL